jgi:hypothetical protein
VIIVSIGNGLNLKIVSIHIGNTIAIMMIFSKCILKKLIMEIANYSKVKGESMRTSKEILVEEAENGYIIKVTYYEFLNSLGDFVKLEKLWIAETEKEKDARIRSIQGI